MSIVDFLFFYEESEEFSFKLFVLLADFLPILDSCLVVMLAGADIVLLYCPFPKDALKVFIIFLDPDESEDWLKASLALDIFVVKISLPFSEFRKSRR